MRVLVMTAAAAAACHGPAPAPDPVAPRAVVELARFSVHKDGARLGTLVHREIRDPSGPVRYFLVENASGQWLGYADAQGRFYRYAPFAERESFLGVYTMDKGLSVLYDVAAPLRIEPAAAAIEARPAAARKDDRR
jgi:hypothetical protein